MAEPLWSQVWNVDFGVPVGHEQGARRPAIVVSADWFNESAAELHHVVPLSSTIRSLGTHFAIEPPEGGLDVRSDAMVEHLRAVSRERFLDQRGTLEAETMGEITNRVKVLLLLRNARAKR
ncbi:MAG: type II toxin-antitoxin system PemK/MazF family toxin [Actinobacteria bacterium]|nr:type II toxin-antitoxin system PemK/MazF family toxin [Actinomycetota bacterium]